MTNNTIEFMACGHTLNLHVSDHAFMPNMVTQKLAESAEIIPGSTVLDLGCGVGPIGILAAKQGAGQVDAIDVVPQAIECARKNIKLNNVADLVTVYHGDLFAPVGNKRYDIIINDVSGIQEQVSRISPWYPDSVPSGGDDGTEVVLRMMEESRHHLNSGGSLYFATSSLSNVPRILDKARAVYGDVAEQLKTVSVPFCKELNDAVDTLKKLQEQGKIAFEQRRSRYLWNLDIFRVRVA